MTNKNTRRTKEIHKKPTAEEEGMGWRVECSGKMGLQRQWSWARERVSAGHVVRSTTAPGLHAAITIILYSKLYYWKEIRVIPPQCPRFDAGSFELHSARDKPPRYYLLACRVIITINVMIWGCTVGGVYAHCILMYSHVRWKLP